jgi:UDP-glucose 4-epimerase
MDDSYIIDHRAFRGARVLVTGASGYLGNAISSRLINLGASVTGLSRSTSTVSDGRIDWIAGDVCDAALVDDIFRRKRPRLVFHLAGETNASRHLDRVLPTFRANAYGTVVVLEACARYGCDRFLYCASMEEPSSGTSAVSSSPYGTSKWVGNTYTRMFHQLFAVPSAIVRPFFVYGPGRQSQDKLVPHVVHAYLRGESPKLGSPNRGMDWVFIDDVVHAFLLAAQLDAAVGAEFDVGTGTLTTVREFTDVVRHALGNNIEPTFDPGQTRHNEASRIADRDALWAVLGWAPNTSLIDGVQRTLAWYRERLSSS